MHTNYIYNNIFSICEHRSLADKMNVKSMDFLSYSYIRRGSDFVFIFLSTLHFFYYSFFYGHYICIDVCISF